MAVSEILKIKKRFPDRYYVWLFSIVVIYVFLTTWFLTPAPKYDDYDAILGFLNSYSQASSLHEKIKLLLSQHNEHRIVLSRLIYLATLRIFGSVDLRMFQCFGNCIWLTLSLCLLRGFKEWRVRLLAACLFFCFRPVELMSFSMAALQQYMQISFSVLSVWYYLKAENEIASVSRSIVFMLLSCLSGGGWVVLAPVAISKICLQKGKVLQSDWIYAIGLLACFFFYFVFVPFVFIGQSSLAPFEVKSFVLIAGYFVTFLGSIFENSILAILLGLIFLYFAYQIFNSGLSFLSLLVSFVLATAAVTTFSRSWLGVSQALSSRYTIYSILVAYCFLRFYEGLIIQNKAVYRILLFLIAIFFVDSVIKGARDLYGNKIGTLHGDIHYPQPKRALEILKQSQELGICRCEFVKR